jgi:hypothetical protein
MISRRDKRGAKLITSNQFFDEGTETDDHQTQGLSS